jgi:beta-aspartyl-dipeptidase (metallo-type)
MGRCHILIADGRIAAISEADITLTGVSCTVIDLDGHLLCPGFIDNHAHVLGGGGELGFSSRASELQTSQIVRHGITTVISMLGFDATSKSVASLVSKTRAFREDGLSGSSITAA